MSTQIRLGTSSFTADGWNGAFYPKGMKSADCLRYYSTRFDTVEVDSTFYRCPTIEAVNNWALKTPPGFIFMSQFLERLFGTDLRAGSSGARRFPISPHSW